MAFSRKEKLSNDLGRILEQRRVMVSLVLKELSARSGISSSHLCRIERGERFPSAHVLRKIAKPLGFDEVELLSLAGYLSPQASTTESGADTKRLDPYVAKLLASEPVEVQRAVITILTVRKSMGPEGLGGNRA